MNEKLLNRKLYKRNKNYELVDSLPFVDTVPVDLDPKVKELIADEMKSILDENNCQEAELLANYLSDFSYEVGENPNISNGSKYF